MSNTTISPNMNLIVPTPSVDPGPDWANNINASLSIIDQHNHSPGSGVQITPAGININVDLPFNANNATGLRSVRFNPQIAPLGLASDIGCLYEVSADLYYNDGAGNQIRITESGSVTGSAGTITGLPSGTASAAYSAGTFTFQSATSTPANLAVGPITLGTNTAGSKTITISPTVGQAANYNLFLPAVAPTANQVLVSDGSGNLTWTRGLIPLGSVIATFPSLTGAYTTANTTAADANGYVLCVGQTISDATSPMNTAVIPNINNSVFLQGSTVDSGTGGTNSTTLTTTQLPAHTHGAGSYATSIGVSNGTLGVANTFVVSGGTASLTGTTSFASTAHTHNMSHYHQWGYTVGTGGSSNDFYGVTSASTNQGSFTSSGTDKLMSTNGAVPQTGSTAVMAWAAEDTDEWYTSGSLGQPSGSGSTAQTGTPSATATVGLSSTAASLTGTASLTGLIAATGSNSVTGTSASAGTGSAYDSRPNYINAVYLMRIK